MQHREWQLVAILTHADVLAVGSRTLADLVRLKSDHGHSLALESLDDIVGQIHLGQRRPENFSVRRGNGPRVHREALHAARVILEVG